MNSGRIIDTTIDTGEQEIQSMKNNNRIMGRRTGLFHTGATLQWLLFWCLLLAISRPGMAGQGPVEVLQSMTNTLEEIVKQDPDIIYDEQRLRVIAHDVVLPHVDMRTMSRWVLGKNWRKATPEQRDAFVIEFQELLLSSYLRQVKTYDEEVARFLPLRGGQKEGRAVVNAEIDQPNGPVIHVIFRMHQVKTEWLIFDVSVEGISLVATHRSSFNSEIRNKGLDELIARLQKMNE
jgi:phospholipid transport system substrate-binding protein